MWHWIHHIKATCLLYKNRNEKIITVTSSRNIRLRRLNFLPLCTYLSMTAKVLSMLILGATNTFQQEGKFTYIKLWIMGFDLFVHAVLPISSCWYLSRLYNREDIFWGFVYLFFVFSLAPRPALFTRNVMWATKVSNIYNYTCFTSHIKKQSM